jgi:membrane protease YdiL (CAAX protease family)
VSDPEADAPAQAAVPLPRRVLPAERVGAAIEVALCSGFPTQLALILLMSGSGMPLKTGDGHLSPAFVFTLSLVDAVVVVGLVLLLLGAHRESARGVLFGGRPILREALLGILVVPAVFMLVLLVLMLVLAFAPGLHNVPVNPLEDMLRTRRDALIFGMVVMIAGGVREEVQRGFILHRFGQYLGGAWLGVAIYSVVFGLGHYEQGYDAMVVTAVLGAAWGALYLVRRSIVAPMVSHATFNLAQLAKYFVLR